MTVRCTWQDSLSICEPSGPIRLSTSMYRFGSSADHRAGPALPCCIISQHPCSIQGLHICACTCIRSCIALTVSHCTACYHRQQVWHGRHPATCVKHSKAPAIQGRAGQGNSTEEPPLLFLCASLLVSQPFCLMCRGPGPPDPGCFPALAAHQTGQASHDTA